MDKKIKVIINDADEIKEYYMSEQAYKAIKWFNEWYGDDTLISIERANDNEIKTLDF